MLHQNNAEIKSVLKVVNFAKVTLVFTRTNGETAREP